MRFLLSTLSVLMVFFAVAPGIFIAMGGGELRDNEYDRARSSEVKNPVERSLKRGFYWLLDNRKICAVVGMIGLAVSFFWHGLFLPPNYFN